MVTIIELKEIYKLLDSPSKSNIALAQSRIQALIDSHPAKNVGNELSKRQKEVLDLVSKHYGDTQIAEELGISVGRAKKHVRKLREKLGISTKRQLALAGALKD